MLSDVDAAYVRTYFVPLASVAEGDPAALATLIRDRHLPLPPYELDGTPYVPADYLAPVHAARGVERLRPHFEERYVLAADTFGAIAGPDELDEAWELFLDGIPHARLVEATPENMIREARLVAAIERLIDEPAPDDWRWANRLRARVEQLEALTRPGIALDRERHGGPLPRDLYVDDVRRVFAAAFASA